MTQISPSILGVDLKKMGNILEKLEKSGADMVHVDIMDDVFVPNTSFDLETVKFIYEHTSLPLDVHLMVQRPSDLIEEYAKYSQYIGIHYEADCNVKNDLIKIRDLDTKSCIVIKPKTAVRDIYNLLPYCDMVLVMSVEPGFGGQQFMDDSVDKVKELKHYIKENNLNVLIEIDGGINNNTAVSAVNSGVDVLVVGSYLFKDENLLSDKISYFKSL